MAGLLNRLGGFIENKMPQVQGLLGDPTFNLGIGLLSAAGPSTTPVGFGQAFAGASNYASQREQAAQEFAMKRQQMEANREFMRQNQKQQQAQEQLQRLLSNPAANVPAGIRAPNAMANEQSQMMGLLSQAYPQQYGQAMVQSLLSPTQPEQLPTSAEEFQYLNSLPPDQQAAYAEMLNPVDSSKQIADYLAQITAEDRLNDRKLKADELAEIERTRVTGRKNAINQISVITDLIEKAGGTLIQPGVFGTGPGKAMSGVAFMQRAVGMDPTRAEELATISGTLNKELNALNGRVIPDAYLGSNQKLQFYAEGAPSMEQEMGTNLSILKMILQDQIDADYADDGVVSERASEDAQKLIERIQGLIDGGPVPPAGFVPETP